MRGKDYDTGLRGVLFEAPHYQRMGAAIWLYGWLVLRQTHQQGGVGWVLGGAPVSYSEIEEETGFNARTLERWMKTLRQQGYIETEVDPAGVVIRIAKAKKFVRGPRNSAEGARRIAGGDAQPCVANERQSGSNRTAAARIRSSTLDGSKAKIAQEVHRGFHDRYQKLEQSPTPNPPELVGDRKTHLETVTQPGLGAQQPLFASVRERLQLLRAERDEAVRRELAVGTGPEGPHS
jgi:hypothetical protein